MPTILLIAGWRIYFWANERKSKSGGFIRKISILRVKKFQIYGLSTYGLSNCECVSDIPLKILEILCDFLSFTANNM